MRIEQGKPLIWEDDDYDLRYTWPSKSWTTLRMTNGIQIVPASDGHEHDTDDPSHCLCGTSVEYLKLLTPWPWQTAPFQAIRMYTHQALDGRD